MGILTVTISPPNLNLIGAVTTENYYQTETHGKTHTSTHRLKLILFLNIGWDSVANIVIDPAYKDEILRFCKNHFFPLIDYSIVPRLDKT